MPLHLPFCQSLPWMPLMPPNDQLGPPVCLHPFHRCVHLSPWYPSLLGREHEICLIADLELLPSPSNPPHLLDLPTPVHSFLTTTKHICGFFHSTTAVENGPLVTSHIPSSVYGHAHYGPVRQRNSPFRPFVANGATRLQTLQNDLPVLEPLEWHRYWTILLDISFTIQSPHLLGARKLEA